jgi:hypothetical protein
MYDKLQERACEVHAGNNSNPKFNPPSRESLMFSDYEVLVQEQNAFRSKFSNISLLHFPYAFTTQAYSGSYFIHGWATSCDLNP